MAPKAKKPAVAAKSSQTKAKSRAMAKPAAKTRGKSVVKVKTKPAARATAKPQTRSATATPPHHLTGGAHPSFALLTASLPPGRHAGGAIVITPPDAHHAEMSTWLGGRVTGRVAIGRTAFGDLLVFRDLRDVAAAQGLPGADTACDIAMVEMNHKSMVILGYSVEEFLDNLGDPAFRRAYLRGPLYKLAKTLLGDFADDEAYTFVPALPLGGSETADCIQRGNWQVYQSILFQL